MTMRLNVRYQNTKMIHATGGSQSCLRFLLLFSKHPVGTTHDEESQVHVNDPSNSQLFSLLQIYFLSLKDFFYSRFIFSHIKNFASSSNSIPFTKGSGLPCGAFIPNSQGVGS